MIETQSLSITGRVLLVVENTTRHLIVPAANFVVSYLVITIASAELWGQFAIDLLVVNLCAHVLAWGNKEYLLRAMSSDPHAAASLWQSSLLSRLFGLPLPILLLAALGIDGRLLMWLVGWLLLAFLYQSFDVVVLFGHRFRLGIGAELSGLATTVMVLLSSRAELDEGVVVAAYVMGLLVKALFLLAGLAPSLFEELSGRPSLRHIREALPFTLMGLSGLLQSRVDLYAVAMLAGPADMGRYQVTASLFIAFQAVAAFVMMPFVRELYSSDDERMHMAARRLALGGIGVVGLGIPVSWLVLNVLYDFKFGWPIFIVGALMVVPVYRYVPRIYLNYKHGRERIVVVVSFAGAAVNLGLAVLLISKWSILGALSAAAISQWFAMICYEIDARRRRKRRDAKSQSGIGNSRKNTQNTKKRDESR